jgi:hypothetical protein
MPVRSVCAQRGFGGIGDAGVAAAGMSARVRLVCRAVGPDVLTCMTSNAISVAGAM